jgi:catechol 2,3-dioxygenase-like lactoylglutathione lyase family enzyme
VRTRPKLDGLRHVALYVADMERSLVFYRDVMGMALEWKPDPDNAYLTSGSDNLALHRRPASGDDVAFPVLDHIGFLVPTPEDVDDWAGYLAAHNVPLAMSPRTHRDGARSLYLLDPDGIRIQIIYHPPISSGGPGANASG